MSEFNIEPEAVRAGAEAMFAASEAIYEAMNTLVQESSPLEGSAEAVEFVGIAECVQAVQVWETDYIAVHRADIEDLAMSAAISAETSAEADGDISSAFDQYADSYFPDGRTAPAPERPAPDPSTQMPVNGESVAVA
ncbi:hypothetical protein [Glycomyces buryatensis]|uniref:PE domain-containing protein n=1 Tax=Glycomyces buryatensis TaxID=2570927 RepID=A0A4S8Q8N7_9ACTN|nr:hypothetical protein [Glycomyces buryatensis]THV40638.1 hypothetical protein FAB82_15365 [Glycomyces buryatensis]